MKRKGLSLLVTLGVACLTPTLASAASIYNEGFSGSTLNSGSPALPTASSTDYSVLASKSTSASSLGSTLDLTIGATSSGLAEVQALFTTAPVTLSLGSYIRLQTTFQSTHLLDGGGSSSGNQTINIGLYNSGGVGPVTGGVMANGLLGTADSTYASGYAAGWKGYVGRIGNIGGTSSQIYTRDPQSDTTNESQDAVFNDGVTGGFDTPAGQFFAGSGGQLLMSDGIDYTMTLEIAYTGAGVAVTHNLFQGAGTGGANVYTHTGLAPSGFEYTTFDSLAFGFRGRNTDSQAIHWTMSSLEVTTGVVPEPSSMALAGLAGLAMLAYRRR